MHRVVHTVIKIPKKSASISLDKRTCSVPVSTYPYGGWSIKIPTASDIRAKNYHLDVTAVTSFDVPEEGKKGRRKSLRAQRDLATPCRASRGYVHHVCTDVYANKRTAATCNVLVTRSECIDMRNRTSTRRGRRCRQVG